MKRFLLRVLLFLFVVEYASAQSIEELNSRRIKERKQSSYTSAYTSRHSRSIDWDVDDDTWGLAYTYSPHFPLSISANGTWSYFQLGGEFGLTLSGKEFDWKENTTAKPIGYLMASPGFYCKFLSVQCGVGALFDIRKETNISTGTNISQTTSITIGSSTSISSYSDESNYQYSSYETSKLGFNLCFKPSVTGYIPIEDGDYYITINAGYLFVPKLKDLNGFTVGVGFQITID